MELHGLILSGGESKRMGTDKGLIQKDGVCWVKLMQQKLLDLDLDVQVSINHHQFNGYKKIFPETSLIVDQIEIPGPLRGLLSAHLIFPDNNWIVLACDMIDMDSKTIHQIIKATKENNDFDFYTYHNGSYFEPFCAIYTAKGLSKIAADYQNNYLEDFSMQSVFKNNSTFKVHISNHEKAFTNHNSGI